MANIYNAEYKRFNGTDWDVIHFATKATQVLETTERKWLTATQQTNLNSYLVPANFNQANKLVQLNASAKIPSNLIDANFTDYLRRDGTLAMTGNLNMGSNKILVNELNSIGTNLLLSGTNKVTLDTPETELLGDLRGLGATLTSLNVTSKFTTGTAGFGIDVSTSARVANNVEVGGELKVNTITANNTLPSLPIITVEALELIGGTGGIAFRNAKQAVSGTDVPNWEQVQSIAADGLKPMPPVRVATTANNTLSGFSIVDGVALVAGDRVLVKNQTTASQNGVYTAANGAWTKITAQSQKGFYGQVLEGTVNRGTWYYADTNTSWELHSVPDEYGVISGGGLKLVGMNFGIDDGKVTNAMLAGSIANTKIASWAGAENVTPTAATTSKSLSVHINQLYTQIKNIRGTANFHTAVSDTILSVKGIAESKNKNYIGTAAPANDTGLYKDGDVYIHRQA